MRELTLFLTTDGAACHSTLPSSVFTPTGGCQIDYPSGDLSIVNGTWTVAGRMITGVVDKITGTILLITSTTSFTPAEATSYVGVAVSDMFTLVHQASDTAVASTASASSTSKTNAAVRVRGNENGRGVVTAVCLPAMVLGALLVV